MSEKAFALHHFLTPKNSILEALWKQMLVYFKDVVRFYLIGWRMVGGSMISLQVLAVWTSWTYILIFHFNWIFGNSTILERFNTSIDSIETLKFSRQFGLQWPNYDEISHKKSNFSLNLKCCGNKITN